MELASCMETRAYSRTAAKWQWGTWVPCLYYLCAFLSLGREGVPSVPLLLPHRGVLRTLRISTVFAVVWCQMHMGEPNIALCNSLLHSCGGTTIGTAKNTTVSAASLPRQLTPSMSPDSVHAVMTGCEYHRGVMQVQSPPLLVQHLDPHHHLVKGPVLQDPYHWWCCHWQSHLLVTEKVSGVPEETLPSRKASTPTAEIAYIHVCGYHNSLSWWCLHSYRATEKRLSLTPPLTNYSRRSFGLLQCPYLMMKCIATNRS